MKFSIISTSTGNGHNAVMNALREEFEYHGYEVGCYPNFYEDLMPSNRVLCNFYNSLLMSSMELCVKYNELSVMQGEEWQNVLYSNCYDKIDNFIQQDKPSAVISTTPLLNKLMLRYLGENKRNEKIPFYEIITDPYDPIYPGFDIQGAAAYFAPNDVVGRMLLNAGIEAKRIKVSGFPVSPKFHTKWFAGDKARICNQYHLEPDKPVFLINSGAQGSTHYLDIFNSILDCNQGNFQIVMICGKNNGLLNMAKFYSNRKNHKGVVVLPYAYNMEELLYISDICITKAGANTVYECLQTNTALVIDAIKGLLYQEKGIIDFVDSNKVGYILRNINQIQTILYELKTQENIEQLKNNVRMMKLENGSPKIVRYILQDLLSANKMGGTCCEII